MWTKVSVPISVFFSGRCNLHTRDSLFVPGEPNWAGRLIDQPKGDYL